MAQNKIDLTEIRRTAITALFSDELLTESLVLKGGNALNLVYGITSRSSIDLDFGMRQDFPDFEDAKSRLFLALHNRFDAIGYTVFDEVFEKCPQLKGSDEKPWWGGYLISFKLIDRQKYQSLKNDNKKLRDHSLALGSGGRRQFKIDLSKYEYTEGKVEHEMNSFTIYVYTPEMIAIEKIRAICQQMNEYPHTGNKKPRARDFYDIYQVVTTRGIDLQTKENQTLLQHVFEAKQVPLLLLANMPLQREFHRTDWPSVIAATDGELRDFDFFFDFVWHEVEQLKTLWME